MERLLCDLARFIYKHPEVRQRKSYEIFNACPSAHKKDLADMKNTKRILEYISDIKNLPADLLEDCLREETEV